MNIIDDTIVAISTPPGQSGIGIVRLSGPDAISIAAKSFFSPKEPEAVNLSKTPSHTLKYGFIKNEKGETIEEVLLTVMRGPSTYTREDIVEINAHGGIVPLKEVLRLLMRRGARLAQPGEFTKRAFLNGRIDLAQAEAIADFIRAKTVSQARISMKQLEGALSDEILKIKDVLVETAVQLEASIDFSDEELELDSNEVLPDKLKGINLRIENLLSQGERGKILREGVKVVIAGRPNVGKSSLLNTLLSQERAIVTPFPGTTRDTIEEEIELGGCLVRLVDTAGLCKTEDFLEKEGVKRTEMSLKESDLVIFLLDGSFKITREDREIFSAFNGKKTILAINKIDLPLRLDEKALSGFSPAAPVVKISATQRINIEGLLKTVKGLLWKGEIESKGDEIIVSLRHEEIFKNVNGKILEVIRGFKERKGEELIAIDVKEAISHLGEITGEVRNEDVLDRIFSKFCIGK